MQASTNQCTWLSHITIGLTMLLVLHSCQDEPVTPEVTPSVVQFNESEQTVVEGEGASLALHLSQPAPADGAIEISLGGNAIYGEHYETSPAGTDGVLQLGVSKGQSSVQIDVTTIDNSVLTNLTYIIFTVVSVSDDLQIEENATSIFVLEDNEDLSVANFEVNAATVSETNTNGIEVKINLSEPTQDPGSLVILVNGNGAIYEDDFITSPQAIDGKITLDFLAKETSKSFFVFPLRNVHATTNQQIAFVIAEASGVLRKGSSLTYSLTITNEETSGANFAANAAEVMETNINGIEVKIDLSAPAEDPGSLVILVDSNDAIYAQDFITSPQAIDGKITLDFLAKETSKSFSVFPVHNFKGTTNQQIAFVIAEAFGALQKGTSLTYSLTIINEDVVSTVGFAESSRILEEHTEGIIIDIPFSAQSSGEGSITISLAGIADAVYGNEFTTIPAMDFNGLIELPVAFGQESASFKVLPVNDEDCSAQGRSVEFKIEFANGSVEKGASLNCIVTLKDDEKVNSVSFNKAEESINENSPDKITVKLVLSEPLQQDAIIYLNSFCDYWSGTSRFTTSPETYCDYSFGSYLPISMTNGDTEATFTISPTNDSHANGDFETAFRYSGSNSSSNCLTSPPDKNFKLTIIDDE